MCGCGGFRLREFVDLGFKTFQKKSYGSKEKEKKVINRCVCVCVCVNSEQKCEHLSVSVSEREREREFY